MRHEIFAHRGYLRLSKYTAASLCLLAIGMLPLNSADARGAFAAGIPSDVSSGGVAVGAGYNYGTREGAETRALQECLKQTTAPASTIALCKITAYFDNQCVAVSMDPTAGTPGFGWAVAGTADAANRQALENCRQTAGSDRTEYCEVSLTDCDVTSSPR